MIACKVLIKKKLKMEPVYCAKGLKMCQCRQIISYIKVINMYFTIYGIVERKKKYSLTQISCDKLPSLEVFRCL